MTHYTLLLKKQLIDVFPTRSAKKKNIMGTVLMAALVAIIIAAFVLIFSRFTKTYTAIKINRIPDMPARQFEIMSVAYFVILIVLLISGVNKLCYSLFENSDINIFISMPFSAFDLFLAKLTGVYLKQLVMSLVFVVTVNFTFFFTTGLVNAYNICMTFVVALVTPIVPLALASIIALPYYYIKRLVSTKYLLSFIMTTLLMAAFAVAYAFLFKFAENLLNAGKLASLFNEKVMGRIVNFSTNCYPANLIANIMLARDLGKSIGIYVGILAGSLIIGSTIIHAIFIRVTQSGFSMKIPHITGRKLHFVKMPRRLSLIAKEFIIVLRTPGYSFMYFTTAIIMPIMVYYSAKLSTTLISGTLGGVSAEFEVCTFITLLYSTLTNTFCSTSISRDGYMCMTQKAMPYSASDILSAKIFFGGFVSETSIVVTCAVLLLTKIEQPVDVLVTFFSATLLASAQLVLGTRMDLDHPHFSKLEDGEIKEANSTVSALILIGLVADIIIGVLLLFNTVRCLITGDPTANEKWASFLYALAIPVVLLSAALVYFFVNLKKVYENLDAEV